MARTTKGSKGPGHDYWSRRPMSGSAPGKETKRLTHKLERIEAKDQIKEQLEISHHEYEADRADEIDAALYCYHCPCDKCEEYRNLKDEE